MKIKIITEAAGEVYATLTDENPGTTKALWDALPIDARANTWGDEIYFSIPVHHEEENSKETVELGDLGYWPPGNAFCIFFGPTPASRGDEIRPASPVNVFGKVDGDPAVFKKVRGGAKIMLERV
jgi:hypothetical protein